ncbi:MAG TPA: hypothetical protein VJ482_01740 [Acidimicrobiia bacterium]|nr:hypothetical protein [Acidimicrobiia bacterium]
MRRLVVLAMMVLVALPAGTAAMAGGASTVRVIDAGVAHTDEANPASVKY